MLYELDRHRAAEARMMIMTIHSTKHYRAAIDLDQAILQLDRPETDRLLDFLDEAPVEQYRHNKLIEIWMLSSPFQRIFNIEIAAMYGNVLCKCPGLRWQCDLAGCIVQSKGNIYFRSELYRQIDIEFSISVMFIELGFDEKIFYVALLRESYEEDVSEDPC